MCNSSQACARGFSGTFKQLIIGRLTLKILSLLSSLALVTIGVTADAHAHLQKSSPADNSLITTSPSHLVLNFSEAARLTALSIQKDEEPKQNLKPLPTTAAQQISVPLPPLTPGTYLVNWRVLSEDGHMMAGALHFTLAADRATDHPADHSAQH
jgi:methionine-rich copper-binding protein CopC